MRKIIFIALALALLGVVFSSLILYLNKPEAYLVNDMESSAPVWSPDGSTLAFTSNDPGYTTIRLLSAKNKLSREVAGFDQLAWFPKWSPDGTQLACQSKNGTAMLDIWIVDIKTGAKENLTNDPYPDVTPSWSPDGKKIAYASLRNQNWDILIRDMQNSESVPFVASEADENYPVWSPDGRYLAYSAKRKGNWDIWIIPADGGNQIRLTEDEADDYAPSWSPDSKRIVFCSDRKGTIDLWELSIDSRDSKQLTIENSFDAFASWSPDGSKIIFQSDRMGREALWAIPAGNFTYPLSIKIRKLVRFLNWVSIEVAEEIFMQEFD